MFLKSEEKADNSIDSLAEESKRLGKLCKLYLS